MGRLTNALVRLDHLIGSIEDPRSAYAIRSRLERFDLTLSPLLPELSDTERVVAAGHMREIEHSFAFLKLKSEPFGEAWLKTLRAARASLIELRSLLESTSRS